MVADQELASPLARALALTAARLSTEPALPWLLAGDAALALRGIATPRAPETLLLLTGAAELARVAALLAADEREPLGSRAAPGYASTPRGSYQLVGVAVELVGDAVATGEAGMLPLALEHVWPLRDEILVEGARVPLLSFEVALAVALLQGQAETAHAIAEHLLGGGVRWERLDETLATLPALEQPLWELMDQVRPLANRARSRRARQQLGWGPKKRR